MRQIIPLQSVNQSLEVDLNIDGGVVTLGLEFRYNRIAGYWTMQISNPTSGKVLVDSIPLVRGNIGAANLLGQYAYLNIGSAYLLKNREAQGDYPDETNLGTDFQLLWRDTP